MASNLGTLTLHYFNMQKITVHGKTFESDIDYFRKSAEDYTSPWHEEDKEAIQRWEAAKFAIDALPTSELKYLNENVRENQVLEDLQYYLSGVGLWAGMPPHEHPTIEQEISRRKRFEEELKEIEEEQRKRDEEINRHRAVVVENNDYRNTLHPRFWELHNAQDEARNVISSKAFIEDFGTPERVGGMYLYTNSPLKPPSWLQQAWTTIHDYYMNCGGDYPHPEADFATVMYGLVAGVNGSNSYLMAKNTAQTRSNPTHWTHENDFGKARVVSEGRTLRYGGQCDEVIPNRQDRMDVISARRKQIYYYRSGIIKEINPWATVGNLDPQSEHTGIFTAQGASKAPAPKVKAHAELIETVRGYASENHQGKLHVERWCRVLEALGAEDYPYPPMTAKEAKSYVDRGWKRWVPVLEALLDIEGKTSS